MSFNIALSGLQATSQDLNTISNNIANASTWGFRGGRSEFAAIYNSGMGAGVNVMNTSQNFSREGTLTYTGRELDMGIQGSGFFMLRGTEGSNLYARAGIFAQDALGFITDPVGNRLQGYPANGDGVLQTGTMGDLQIKTGSLPAKASKQVNQVSNLDARMEAIDPAKEPFSPDKPASYHSSGTVSVFDSLGNQRSLTQYYAKTGDNEWKVYFVLDSAILEPKDGHSLQFNKKGSLTSGKELDLTLPAKDGAEDLSLAISYDGFTQYANDYNNSSLSQDGYAAGEFNKIRLDDSGMIYGTYTNGQELLQGQVALADFNNPNGLTPVSNNAWQASAAAGQATIGAPGSGTLGSLKGAYLEGSNVDTTAEMVSLMTAQRNYQSNAKVLDTNSTMQQALLNAI